VGGGVKVCSETAPEAGVGQVVAGAAVLAQVTVCGLLLEQDPSTTAKAVDASRLALPMILILFVRIVVSLVLVVQSKSVQEKV
jgi:uncharacterized membrane protein YdjX (TVP38/TMEM64 family)